VTDRDLDPERLRGVNAVYNCKVRRIAASIMEFGWNDRRLLVEECEGCYFAWTGTHRIVAALLIQRPTVPCTILTQAEADATFGPVYGDRYGYDSWRGKITGAEGSSDAARLRGLVRAGLADAAAMLQQEIDAVDGLAMP
jgi:hypothetical protein